MPGRLAHSTRRPREGKTLHRFSAVRCCYRTAARGLWSIASVFPYIDKTFPICGRSFPYLAGITQHEQPGHCCVVHQYECERYGRQASESTSHPLPQRGCLRAAKPAAGPQTRADVESREVLTRRAPRVRGVQRAHVLGIARLLRADGDSGSAAIQPPSYCRQCVEAELQYQCH